MRRPAPPLPSHLSELYAQLEQDRWFEVHAALQDLLEYVREEMCQDEEELYLRLEGTRATVWAGWSQTSYSLDCWDRMRPCLTGMGFQIQVVDQPISARLPRWRFRGWRIQWSRPEAVAVVPVTPGQHSLEDLLRDSALPLTLC